MGSLTHLGGQLTNTVISGQNSGQEVDEPNHNGSGVDVVEIDASLIDSDENCAQPIEIVEI